MKERIAALQHHDSGVRTNDCFVEVLNEWMLLSELLSESLSELLNERKNCIVTLLKKESSCCVVESLNEGISE